MRRAIGIAALLLGVSAFALTAGGANDDGAPEYKVIFDNAFGLIEGADFKIAGVTAGSITSLDVDRESNKAIVGFDVTRDGGKPLQTDVSCETRPQSLIGEYFVDCEPGDSGTPLPAGATIPVDQTFSTIPADLINNILRLPQRQRLTIILNELGIGLGSRGTDLNEALRRGVPALRETDKLLRILARERETIANLVSNADTVVTALANNGDGVGQFVIEARDTAVASASRQQELQETFAELPGFLEELGPTMRALGFVADEQTPLLADLNRNSTRLTGFFNRLGPFAEASLPATRSLGEASVTGRRAVNASRSTVAELRRLTPNLPELGNNLAIVLEDLNDRDRATEPDPRSPGGRGFTGLEAFVNYAFYQSQSINVFDENGYILKVSVLESECAPYRNAETLQNDRHLYDVCNSNLGPSTPGIYDPDPTARPDVAAARAEVIEDRELAADVLPRATQQPTQPEPQEEPSAPREESAQENAAPPIDIGRTLGELLEGAVPGVDQESVPDAVREGRPLSREATEELLDYLLGA